jgi:F420-non-reducing hydrogenase iron-sulfur subunit
MPRECHYLEGNLRAQQRIARVRQLLTEIGIDGQRIEMFNLSAAMGGRLAEIASEMTERVRALGPNPLGRQRHAADYSQVFPAQGQAEEVQ